MGIMVLLRRAAAAAATANATVSTARAAVHLDRVMLAAVALGQQPQQALRAAANAAAASPGAAWLARLEDHERAGVPRGAGVAGAPGAFDLSRMRALLDALGRPQDRLRAVHVVGTKGKGSVTMLLSAVLHAAGYCVGTYTSPHLLSVRERIALGGGNGSSSSSSCSSSSSSDSSSSSGSSSSGGAAAEPPPSSEAATIISPSDWEVGAARVAAAAEQAGVQPSSFEAVTALALSHFAQAGAQLVVLEAGLGGATDATNVLDGPGVLQAVVLTAVGLDHLEALGDSLASITRAKAGVMQPGVPAVVAKQSPGADGDVVWGEAQAAAAALQPSAPLLRVGDVVSVRPTGGSAAAAPQLLPGPGPHLASQLVDVHAAAPPAPSTGSNAGVQGAGAPLALPSVRLRLVGQHQADNAAAAVATALLLRSRGWAGITDEAIRVGLESAWLPGRFQVAQLADSELHYVLDGAHTGASAAALAATLTAAFPGRPLAIVLAMAEDKQHAEVCEALQAAAPRVVVFTSVLIASSSARAAPPGTLAAHWQAAVMGGRRRGGSRCRELIQASLGTALQRAAMELQGLGAPGVVVVTGSLHAVAAAAKELGLAG